ncbi:fimbrial protein [Serratia fonticola]|uniref:fimbrial protein n=1 Tax=Serratia fonticola TaxID=47917 RepID=UPI0021BDB4EA|nr:fimbrial protein [Serratia fonticola]
MPTTAAGWFAGAMQVLFMLTVVHTVSASDNNLNFDGTLVAIPCTLDPDTTSIMLDFGTMPDKYLYINTRTHSKSFEIRLLDCNPALGKLVIVTFSGTQDGELPGLIALSSGPASGIAIGMEQADGTGLPVNKPLPAHQLITGDNTMTFSGYMQGKPTALQNHSIEPGNFSATATFSLNYP